jgi:hypothetical protein
MSRQRHVQFSIPEPCSVPWHSMSPVDADQRHCSSCDRVITDFSKMSDDELMLYFQHSGGKVCGQFSNDQLNRRIKLLPEKTEKANWWKMLLLIPLSLFSKSAKAQTSDSIISSDQLDSIAEATILVNDLMQIETPLNDSVALAEKKDTIKISADHNELIFLEPVTTGSIAITGCGGWATTGFTQTTVWIEENKRIYDPILDTLFPSRQKAKQADKQIDNPNPYKQLADQPAEKPKPQDPALPASTDITGILPQESRIKKRA